MEKCEICFISSNINNYLYYYKCYECDFIICEKCCISGRCSINCLYKQINDDVLYGVWLYREYDIGQNKKNYVNTIYNNQLDRLKIVEANNKKRKVWTKMYLLNHLISDLANIIIEYYKI